MQENAQLWESLRKEMIEEKDRGICQLIRRLGAGLLTPEYFVGIYCTP
jgi:hypothetical protein